MERFIWDLRKEAENIEKHGLSFSTAKAVSDDPLLVIREDWELSERRLQAIGRAGDRKVLLVVHTVSYANEEDTIIRIMSVRPAERRERRFYGGVR